MTPIQIPVRNQYGRIVRKERAWFIPVEALPRVEKVVRA